MPLLSPKQKQNWSHTIQDFHRWNFSVGAVSSGKTSIDLWKIPYRLRERKELDGIKVITGNTQATVERNILNPLRERFGDVLVKNPSVDNKVKLFGVDCFILGADKSSSADRIHGATIAYQYGDEVTTWNEKYFSMLKSRLRKEYSVFDGTCNPDHPKHYVKQFLDKEGLDLFLDTWQINDNIFLPKSYVDNLKNEYAGTIYYDRFILGKWVAGEGAIYRIFIENKDRYIKTTEELPDFDFIFVGVDPGGNKSGHAIVCCGINVDTGFLAVLKSQLIPAPDTTPEFLFGAVKDFCAEIKDDFGGIDAIYFDNEAQTLKNGLNSSIDIPVLDCVKGRVNNRILTTISLMNRQKFAIRQNYCSSIESALENAVYDIKAKTDVRLDDGTSDIDSLDAFEYTFSHSLQLLMTA